MLRLRVFLFLFLLTAFINARGYTQDKATYRPYYHDPVLKELKRAYKNDRKKKNTISDKIIKREKKKIADKRKKRTVLLFDMKGVDIPPSPTLFNRVFHFSPVAQYMTGTCWSYSSTSFIESEVYRLTKEKIKLSEMHTVYYEYLEKARRWIKKRGYSHFSQGSENNAFVHIYKKYGAVPFQAFRGTTRKDKRHDHTALEKQILAYLKHLKKTQQWDESLALNTIQLMLNKHLGTPPQEFSYKGKRYTPKTFLKNVLKFNPDHYVEIMSTKKQPFYTRGIFDVPDNWWKSHDYHNIPLDLFYRLIKKAIQSGYSVATGGDVSEPGKNGFKDAAVIPNYDIPQSHINQESREYRIFAKNTEDDHGIHLVGYLNYKGRDWFLIKDSGRSARMGKHKGYYFFRDDFIRLKMLTFTVHKDILAPYLKRFKRRK